MNIPQEIKYGNIPFGKESKQILKIKNTENKDVVITNIGHSCSCTSVNLASSLVKPNEYIEFTVSLTPGSTGIFKRSFWFSVGGKTYTVNLLANVS